MQETEEVEAERQPERNKERKRMFIAKLTTEMIGGSNMRISSWSGTVRDNEIEFYCSSGGGNCQVLNRQNSH
jgi:hypothetical protein